jgi:hypothetical protein
LSSLAYHVRLDEVEDGERRISSPLSAEVFPGIITGSNINGVEALRTSFSDDAQKVRAAWNGQVNCRSQGGPRATDR